jgi:hypothetical protein
MFMLEGNVYFGSCVILIHSIHLTYHSVSFWYVLFKTRRTRWVGHVKHMGKMRNMYKILIGKPEVQRPLGIRWRGCEDSIKIDITRIGCGAMD